MGTGTKGRPSVAMSPVPVLLYFIHAVLVQWQITMFFTERKKKTENKKGIFENLAVTVAYCAINAVAYSRITQCAAAAGLRVSNSCRPAKYDDKSPVRSSTTARIKQISLKRYPLGRVLCLQIRHQYDTFGS